MIKVGVIRGGAGSHFDTSIRAGGVVLSNLKSDKFNSIYKPVDIFIDEAGVWHIGGIPASMDKVYQSIDVVFNILHGDYGESGKLAQLLEQWKIPHTGSSPFSSALSYNRILAKEEFAKLGIKTPRHIMFEAYQEDLDGKSENYPIKMAREVHSKLPPPWVVKPVTRESSMGTHICKTMDELVFAFEVAMKERVSVLIEEMIIGKSTSISVVDNFRNRKTYPFICAGDFSFNEKREAENLATQIHNGLHLNHFSQSDFVVTPKKGIYAIQVRTVPKLEPDSLLQGHLEAVGSSMSEFINHLIKFALKK